MSTRCKKKYILRPVKLHLRAKATRKGPSWIKILLTKSPATQSLVLWAEEPRLSSSYMVTFFCQVTSGRKRKAWCLWWQPYRRATSTTCRWENSPLSGYIMTSQGRGLILSRTLLPSLMWCHQKLPPACPLIWLKELYRNNPEEKHTVMLAKGKSIPICSQI